MNQLENGISFQLQDVAGEISGYFHYKVLFITAKGNFKVKFADGGIKLAFDMPLHNQDVNGRLLPKISLSDFLL